MWGKAIAPFGNFLDNFGFNSASQEKIRSRIGDKDVELLDSGRSVSEDFVSSFELDSVL